MVDIEKLDGICSLTFVMSEFSGLFLYPSVFSIKHSRSSWIINGALSGFWYWLNSNIFRKHYNATKIFSFTHFFMRFPFVSSCKRMKKIQTKKTTWYFDGISLNNAGNFFTVI